jgi:hypothetical protein
MPRAKTVSINEVQDRLRGSRGRYFTNKRGQKFVVFEKKHKFPRGHGIRVQFKRKSSGSLTDQLREIKRNQERAEKQAGVKKGNGLFDNPLSSEPQVIGVQRVIRKQQIARQLKAFKAGKRIKLSKKAQKRLLGVAKQKGARIPRGTDPQSIILLSQL